MILRNINHIETNQNVSLEIKGGKIHQIGATIKEIQPALAINFTGELISPGLINSHDHLDFNLFPQLGSKIYANYTEWGKDIHKVYTQTIDSILTVPIELRENWGIYKNLLCGVTTVVNHGEKLKITAAPIQVLEDNLSLHSVHFEKNWKAKLNNPFNHHAKAVIHIGEGTDQAAQAEINTLIKWNILKRKLIGIHGVALTHAQAKSFEALVWCPQSNYFLLNRTANIEQLKMHVPILFGTDSTLTSNWNIWDHLRLAQRTNLLTDSEIYQTLTTNPAKTWGLNSGNLTTGSDANLVVIKNKAFFKTQPSDMILIMYLGNILLFDESLKIQLSAIDLSKYSRISINNSIKYVIGNLPKLMEEIREFAPSINFPDALKDN